MSFVAGSGLPEASPRGAVLNRETRVPAANAKSGYLPALDGWRAIAILAVMFVHDPEIHRLGPLSTRPLHVFGWAGVDLFFAISGILICSRLLEEERSRGAISLRGFYVRRAFRILPAAYAFLFGYLLLCLTGQLVFDFTGWAAAILMVRNFFGFIPPPKIYTDHFWSLSVEEHFYLLLPGLLVLVRRHRALLLAVLAVTGCLWSMWLIPGWKNDGVLIWRTDMRLHSLLFPALLAVILFQPAARDLFRRWLHPAVALALFAGFYFLFHRFGPDQSIRQIVIPICFPLIVASTMLHPQSLLGRALEFTPLRFVGRLSYSLYLWQQIFVIRTGGPIGAGLAHLQVFPLNYLAPFGCAIASYYLLEKRLIRAGHRLAPPATPGHPGL